MRAAPAAIFFDRDGTLIVDVPYNGDPDKVVLMPGAREAVEAAHSAGVPTALISNQSGIARGLITDDDVVSVNRRVEALLGRPLGPWLWCPHGPWEDCGCRKPRPELLLRAAEALAVDVTRCVMIGDFASDAGAARAARARGIVVPTERTRSEPSADADEIAPALVAAVMSALRGPPVRASCSS